MKITDGVVDDGFDEDGIDEGSSNRSNKASAKVGERDDGSYTPWSELETISDAWRRRGVVE
jgi:hypothetical protein